MSEWAEQWPDARRYAPPGLARKKPDLRFGAALSDEPDPVWAADIDPVIVRSSFVMDEVAFFHRTARTAIMCDLIQRHRESAMLGWKGRLMRLDGLVGEQGSTPREWRATFLRRQAARDNVLAWKAERRVIAHGEYVQTEATSMIATALCWI